MADNRETIDMKAGEKGAWISIGAYLLLSAAKVAAGWLLNSEALLADGLNNTTDIIASVAILVGLRISQKPPDRDHPYGHLRAQTVSSLIASFIMATVCIQVVIQAVQSLLKGSAHTPDMSAAWVAIASAACMFLVYRYNKRTAERINNHALMAAAQDNRSDMLVSIGVAVGVFAARFGAAWVDPVAALAVGVVIGKTAWDIFKQASHALTDGFDVSELDSFRRTAAGTPGVSRIKDIKARIHGNHVLVDIVVLVDPRLSVAESHAISDQIERRMHSKHNVYYAHVHIEPMRQEAKLP